jgi:hypothetical protein
MIPYDTDFALWVAETVKQLKTKDFDNLDLENLIEEIESLTKRDKRELQSRLTTLFEHALKRVYVNLPDCYRGWEVTLIRTQQELSLILEDSPSLRNFLSSVILKCYQKAVKNMKIAYEVDFPEDNTFSNEIDVLLNDEFWS